MNTDLSLVGAYSEALFEAAKKAGSLDAVSNQALTIENLVSSDPKLRSFMEAPNIPRETKEQVFVKVFGGRFDALLVNFVRLLIRRGRLDVLFASLASFRQHYRKHLGLASGEVYSAVELPDAQKKSLTAALEKRIGKKLEIDFKIDPKVLGGIRFRSGDILIDNTIAHRLVRLRRELLNARVV